MNTKFVIIWLAALVINVALYFYHQNITKERKSGTFLKGGVQMWRFITNGPKNKAWFFYICEDITVQASFAGILGIMTQSAGIFWLFFGLGLIGVVLKLYGHPYLPYFYNRKGMWSFACFNFYYVRGFGTAILASIVAGGLFFGLGNLFEGIQAPIWLLAVLVVVLLVPALFNIYYIFRKISPLFTRFYIEHADGVLRLYSRFSRREIAAIDFKKPYLYERAADVRRVRFAYHYEVHIFAQDNKAIAISDSLYGLPKKLGERGRPVNFNKIPWILRAKLPGKVAVTYEITPEECEERFADIVKKYQKKN